jgi:hypothetical protein
LLWRHLNGGPWMPRIEVRIVMAASDSLATVAWLHGAAQILGLAMLVLLAAATVYAYLHVPRRDWPVAVDMPGFPVRTRWFAIERLRLPVRSLEITAAVAVGLLIIVEFSAYALGHRHATLLASVQEARGDQVSSQAARLERQAKQIAELQRQRKEFETRRTAEAAHSAEQIASLQQQLKDANSQFVEYQRTLGQRRLTKDEKDALVTALKPFAGQKVTIASIEGDSEGKLLVDDLVAVFDQAGWDHYGEAGISTEQWDRDPVGIEITLNEDDARAGRISAGVGALINVVRKLGLTRDNTIYLNGKVTAGEAQLKVGKKLPK